MATSEMIRKMTKEEFEKFRQECWNNKIKKLGRADQEKVPHWYMDDRQKYLDFLKKSLAKINYYRANQGKSQTTRRVEDLAGDDVDSFADDK